MIKRGRTRLRSSRMGLRKDRSTTPTGEPCSQHPRYDFLVPESGPMLLTMAPMSNHRHDYGWRRVSIAASVLSYSGYDYLLLTRVFFSSAPTHAFLSLGMNLLKKEPFGSPTTILQALSFLQPHTKPGN